MTMDPGADQRLHKRERPVSLGKMALIDGTCGALAGFCTDFLFYGVDSYKVLLQSGQKVRFSLLFKGVFPMVTLGSIPSYAAFWAFYAPLKCVGEEHLGVDSKSAIFFASIVSAVPSSLIFVPADTMKKQVILGNYNSTWDAFSDIKNRQGYRGLFIGWQANLLKDMPFAFEVSLFETLSLLYCRTFKNQIHASFSEQHLDTKESALVGFASGALMSFVSHPLDCINTRIKSGELQNMGLFKAHKTVIQMDGFRALFRGIFPRTIQTSLGSTVFWYMYSLSKTLIHT